MAQYEIPLIADPNQELNIVLDDQNCTIHVYDRGGYLFLDLTLGQDVIAQGAIMMPLMPILQNAAALHAFKGQFYLVDTFAPYDKQAVPHWSGLGGQFKLIFEGVD